MENLFPTESERHGENREQKTPQKNTTSDARGQQRNVEPAEVDAAQIKFGAQGFLLSRFQQSSTQAAVNRNARSHDGPVRGSFSSWFSLCLCACASGVNMFSFP